MQDRPSSHKLRSLFDQTLGQHMERLIGTRYGIGDLPINLTTIAYLILLAEREGEIHSLPSNPPERYTHEILLHELVEIGLDPDEGLEAALQDMIEKGYIDIDHEGRYFARKRSISMAQLLDATFPKMPGMNLVAYFVQTIDEAQSGRKDLDSAISQFDQVLEIQGVPLGSQKTQPKPEKAPGPPVDRVIKSRKIKKSHTSRSESRIISSDGTSGQVEIRRLFTEEDGPAEAPQFTPPAETKESFSEPEISSETSSQLCSEPVSDKRNLLGEAVFKDTVVEAVPPAPEEPLHMPEPEERETDLRKALDIEWERAKSLRKEGTVQEPESKYETETVSEEHTPETVDDIIEERIAAFEEGLAMQCPLCKNGEVQTQDTATGKTYYKCSNKNCNFISWGKPFHLVCPQCRNPFLVETSDRDGNTILKCPRATCRYRQRSAHERQGEPQAEAASQAHGKVKSTMNSPTPRKRVARRRVVRRRRK